MVVLHSIEDIRNTISRLKREAKTIGFVPTMGALHSGHLSLIERARTENDVSVVSIFVNPTQFNNKQDLAVYPRNLEQDCKLLETAGCDIVFAPSADEFYEPSELAAAFEFDFGGLDKVMEGKHRPGHFNGVVQVVSKLFRFVQPDKAYFGEKDFQQVAVIRRMVAVMGFEVEIVACPIVREASGLALSSRNELLTPDERKKAAAIWRILNESSTFVPEKLPVELANWVINAINAEDVLEVEYFEIVDGNTLQAVADWDSSDSIVGCIAVQCGKVRLIDNVIYKSL
ncbi:MAG: pantoate--beta-alanine ligase [Prevotellaceae bacterium]|jgi:pantoate--beta-alanine ligase|nr:pantoate--beta-alanine ligase [Prevotellaceae bacterium]